MEEGWATLSLGFQGFIRPQSDYDLFSEANYFSAPAIALGADVWRPNARWALAVEGSLAFELVRSNDVREFSLDTRYKAWHPRLAPLLRYRVRPSISSPPGRERAARPSTPRTPHWAASTATRPTC